MVHVLFTVHVYHCCPQAKLEPIILCGTTHILLLYMYTSCDTSFPLSCLSGDRRALLLFQVAVLVQEGHPCVLRQEWEGSVTTAIELIE